MIEPNKTLGQHWLADVEALEAITEAGELKKSDTVLEIGPGLGSLTKYLAGQAGHVIAVEKDEELAARLSKDFVAQPVQIIADDILKFDLTQLPTHYKVVANIPYYLTSNLLRILSESLNPPHRIVLLVQKEVAERICAGPGQMSLLALSVQLYYECELGIEISADKFEPPPKVDSRVVILTRRSKPLFASLDTKVFFRIAKAGFAGRRKKLRSSLAAGLNLDKSQTDELLKQAAISGDLRAQNLSLADWHKLYKAYNSTNMEIL